jgi:hypothetical protein
MLPVEQLLETGLDVASAILQKEGRQCRGTVKISDERLGIHEDMGADVLGIRASERE